METQSVVDYLKNKYPKVVFQPFKFAFSNALGFILNNDKLIIGFIKKNGNLCKLIEPLNLSNLTNEEIETAIKKIPIVTGFTEKDREKLLGLFQKAEDKYVTKAVHEKVVKELEQKLEEGNAKNVEYKTLFDGESNKLITVKTGYEEQIAKIKNDYDEKSKQLTECSQQLINEKEKVVEGINKYKSEMSEFVKSKDFKIEELEALHNKAMKEKEELQKKLNDTVNVIEAKSKSNQDEVLILVNEKNNIVAEKEALKKNVEELQRELQKQKGTIDELNRKKQELESQTQEIGVLKTQNSDTISELDRLQKEVNNLTSELTQSKSEVNTLTSQLGQSKNELNNLSSELSQSKSDMGTLSTEAGKAKSEMDTLSAELNRSKARIDDLSSEISQKTQTISDLTSELSQKTQTISDLGQSNTDTSEKYKMLEAELNRKLEVVKEIENELAKKNQTIAEIEAALGKKTQEYEALQEEINQKKQMVADTESEVAKKGEAIVELETALSKKTQEYNEIDAKLQIETSEKSRLEAELASKAEMLRGIEEDMNKKTEMVSDMQSEIEKSKSEIQEFNQKIVEKDKQLEVKDKEIEELKKAVSDINIELAKLQDDLSKSEMAKKMEDGIRERCQEKVLKEKQEIIEAIKSYNDKWSSWVTNTSTDFEKYKQKMISELQIVQDNLQKVLTFRNLGKDEKTKLKQNIKDIQLELNKTIADQLVKLNAKDDEIRKLLNDKTANEKLEFQVQEKNKQLTNAEKEIIGLKKELENVRALLAQNNKTVVKESFDYDNCYSILQNFYNLNNIFFRKQEIIKKLDSIISKNIESFGQLSESVKGNIRESFGSVKTEIEKHIKFLDLPKYINNPNFELLKNKSTWKKVSPEFCPEINNILEYWNANRLEYREQDRILTNIYEDLSGAVRVFIRIKPLVGAEVSDKTVSIRTVDNKRQKLVVLDCTKALETKHNVKKDFGEFYGIFDETFTNQDVFTGVLSTALKSRSLKIDIDSIIESAESVSPGLYSSFKQVEDGYSIVLFGYGASGAGKSYSLLGSSGIPGLLHYGLANLQDVSNIKLKYLFEQYYNAVDVNFGKVRGKIHNLIREVPQMREHAKNETAQFGQYIPSGIDVNNIRVDSLFGLLDAIEKYRIENNRIKKTPNNPVSSRSHLFLVFEITFKNGKTGYITIVDTAGRESPLDIYKIFIETSQTKLATLMAPGPVGGEGTVERYRRKDLDPVYTAQHIFQVLKEGFYINETINHIIYFFNQKNYKQTKVNMQSMDPEKYAVSRYYVNPINEEQMINTGNNCLTIPIMKFLDNLSNKNKADVDFRPTKFIMINHVRQEEKYCDQTYETLEFAQAVKST
jgi:chromosome segregation ATPase